jgi:hypothetical protein
MSAALALWRWSTGVDTGPSEKEVASVATAAGTKPIADATESPGTSRETMAHPVPEADATEVVAVRKPARSEAASGVLAVRSQALAGESVVVVEANGRLNDGSVDVVPLVDPPRVLLRLRGIEREFTPYEIEVGSAELDRVRIGHHPEQSPPELYVVLDLTDASVRLDRSEIEDHEIRVVVARR